MRCVKDDDIGEEEEVIEELENYFNYKEGTCSFLEYLFHNESKIEKTY